MSATCVNRLTRPRHLLRLAVTSSNRRSRAAAPPSHMTPASSTTTTRAAPLQQQPPYRLVCRIVLEPTGDDGAGVADEPLLESRPTATTSCCESDAVINFFLSCGAVRPRLLDLFFPAPFFFLVMISSYSHIRFYEKPIRSYILFCLQTALIAFDVFAFFVLCVMHH